MAAFVLAVISGAAGTYVLTLTEDADVGTDLVIQPGQHVIISGDAGMAAAPRWGSGGFTVGEMGSLALNNVAVGALMVRSGGIVVTNSGSYDGDVAVAPGATLRLRQVAWQGQILTQVATQNLQCYQPHTAVSDTWRSPEHGGCPGPDPDWGTMGDVSLSDLSCNLNTQATGVGGDRWYRFASAAGDAILTTPPGENHCCTHYTGWLSGWDNADAAGAPPTEYSIPGRYPDATEGVVEMTACFVDALLPCGQHVALAVVACEGFMLWRLPYTPDCYSAYCTASSGL